MPKDEAGAAWRNFDQERRKRVSELIRAMLRAQRRDPQEAGAVVAELEKWAAWHKLKPYLPMERDDSPFPPEVCRSARALERTLKRQPRGTLAYLFSPASPRNRFWAASFDAETWSGFWLVLGTLTGHARKRGRQLDVRGRSLEQRVLSVLAAARLPWRQNKRAAEILAEVKEHALGGATSAATDAGDARLSKLKRAARRARRTTPGVS